MRVTLTRTRSRILLLILAPLVFASRVLRLISGRGRKKTGKFDPNYLSTIQTDPAAHDGVVLVAFWASYASLWKISAFPIMLRLQSDFGGRCEFRYIEHTPANQPFLDKHDITVVPTILLYNCGVEVVRIPACLAPG